MILFVIINQCFINVVRFLTTLITKGRDQNPAKHFGARLYCKGSETLHSMYIKLCTMSKTTVLYNVHVHTVYMYCKIQSDQFFTYT